MKIKTVRLLCLLFLCPAGMGNAYGQGIVPASHADNAIASDNAYLNNAIIDYNLNCASCPTYSQFTAVTISHVPGSGIPNASLVVDDGVNGPVTYSFSGYTADVIIGQSVTNPHYYNVGVVYALPHYYCTATSGATGWDIFLDVYTFGGLGALPGMILISSNTGNLISNSNHTANPFPHIDIESQYSLPLSGYATTNNFVIAFTDAIFTLPLACGGGANSQFGINLYKATLDAPTTSVTTYNDPLSSTIVPNYADVSFREIFSLVYYDDVIYTFTDQNNYLHIKEYDFTTPGTNFSLSSPYSYGGIMGLHPRVATPRNYVWSLLGYVDYLVVDDYPSTGEVLGFNNLVNAYSYSCYLGPNAYDQHPVVINYCDDYIVGYYHNYDLSTDMYLTENINYTTGTPFYVPDSFYMVNYTNIAPGGSSTFVAYGATCNNDCMATTPSYGNPAYTYTLTDWNNNGTVYNKGALDPHFFKQAHTNGVQNTKTAGDWNFGPNPATEQISIFAPSDIQFNSRYRYEITDITGRKLSEERIGGQKQSINISDFSPGMYMLHIYETGNELKVLKFIKE